MAVMIPADAWGSAEERESAAVAWVRPAVAQVPMMSSADRPVRTIVVCLKGVPLRVVPASWGWNRKHPKAV